jgi:aminoglycoside 2'-N-acetyltransferase I
VQIMSFGESQLPAELRRQVRGIQEQAWPSNQVEAGHVVHDQALRPLTMMLVEDDMVLASLDLLFKKITHAGRRYQACGLSTVVTRKAQRHRGHGRRLVVAAREAIPTHGADLALFTCDRALQGFYESAGFEALAGAVLIGGTAEEPFPSDQAGFDKVTLGAFFSPGARADRASFEHARIELYSGEIDKLW